MFDTSFPIPDLEISIIKLIAPDHDWNVWYHRFKEIAKRLETSSDSLNAFLQNKWNDLRNSLQSKAAFVCANFFQLRTKTSNRVRLREIQAERLADLLGELDAFDLGIGHSLMFAGEFGSFGKWETIAKTVGEMIKKIQAIDYGRIDGNRLAIREEIFVIVQQLTYQQDTVILARLFAFLEGKNKTSIKILFEKNHPIWELQNKPIEDRNGYEIGATTGQIEFIIDHVENRVYFRRLGKNIYNELLRANGFTWNGRRWSRPLSSVAIIAGKKIVEQIKKNGEQIEECSV